MGAVSDSIDLLTDILVRVPPKTLIRLKSVSKTWFSLISDPDFGITHTRRNTNINSTVSGFYYQNYGKDYFISLNRLKFTTTKSLDLVTSYDLVNPEIVHSCNGLFLFQQRYSLCPIVFNPTTQNYRVLPMPLILPYGYVVSHSYDCFLAFEPFISHHYKVVMMSKEPFRDHYHVLIFASHRKTWEEKFVTAKPGVSCTWRIYWNGAIHWLNYDKFHMQFDIDSDKIIVTPLPPNIEICRSETDQHLVENNGRLFLIQYYPKLQMFEMDANTHCWTIKAQIDLRPLALQFPEMNPIFDRFVCCVVYIQSEDDMKNFRLVLAIPGKFVFYEVKNDNSLAYTSFLCKFQHSISHYNRHNRFVHPFIQCLAPV